MFKYKWFTLLEIIAVILIMSVIGALSVNVIGWVEETNNRAQALNYLNCQYLRKIAESQGRKNAIIECFDDHRDGNRMVFDDDPSADQVYKKNDISISKDPLNLELNKVYRRRWLFLFDLDSGELKNIIWEQVDNN